MPLSYILKLFEGLILSHILYQQLFVQGRYKVYNLCSERLYAASLFQGKVYSHLYFPTKSKLHFGGLCSSNLAVWFCNYVI